MMRVTLSISSACRSTPLLFTSFFFFFNDTATTEIYTLSLHDALPISRAVALPYRRRRRVRYPSVRRGGVGDDHRATALGRGGAPGLPRLGMVSHAVPAAEPRRRNERRPEGLSRAREDRRCGRHLPQRREGGGDQRTAGLPTLSRARRGAQLGRGERARGARCRRRRVGGGRHLERAARPAAVELGGGGRAALVDGRARELGGRPARRGRSARSARYQRRAIRRLRRVARGAARRPERLLGGDARAPQRTGRGGAPGGSAPAGDRHHPPRRPGRGGSRGRNVGRDNPHPAREGGEPGQPRIRRDDRGTERNEDGGVQGGRPVYSEEVGERPRGDGVGCWWRWARHQVGVKLPFRYRQEERQRLAVASPLHSTPVN